VRLARSRRIDGAEGKTVTTVEMLKEVAVVHIRRYATRLEKGLQGMKAMGGYVRIDEVARYLRLWASMVEKHMDVTAMTPAEKAELRDAVNDQYVVHILKEGHTLCGVPWLKLQVEDQKAMWISFQDQPLLMFANCQKCCEVQGAT
jgi:hypothetical protein